MIVIPRHVIYTVVFAFSLFIVFPIVAIVGCLLSSGTANCFASSSFQVINVLISAVIALIPTSAVIVAYQILPDGFVIRYNL